MCHCEAFGVAVFPSREKSDVYLQCLTTLVMGGNGLCRPGGNLGVEGLGV